MMKKVLFLALISFISLSAWSQEETSDDGRIRPIEVNQPTEFPKETIQEELDALVQPVLPVGEVVVQSDVIKTRFDRHEAIKLTIPEASEDAIRKEWSKYMKKNADGKLKNVDGRVLVSDVTLPSVSGGAFSAELQMESDPEKVFLWIAMERDSAMLTSSTDATAFEEMKSEARTRGVTAYQSVVEKEMQQEEKVLNKMISEYDALVRNNDRMHTKIDNFNKKIVDDNNALDINTKNIADAEVYVDQTKEKLDAAVGDEEKAAKKEVKKAEKQLKSLITNEGKLNNRLLSYQQEIRENEQGIIDNLGQQKDKIMAIRKQELLLDAYRTKYDQIQ